jgi:hypothetical protein
MVSGVPRGVWDLRNQMLTNVVNNVQNYCYGQNYVCHVTWLLLALTILINFHAEVTELYAFWNANE